MTARYKENDIGSSEKLNIKTPFLYGETKMENAKRLDRRIGETNVPTTNDSLVVRVRRQKEYGKILININRVNEISSDGEFSDGTRCVSMLLCEEGTEGGR